MTQAGGKVIIRGHIFDYAEKSPFMPSGASVLGAIEYDEQRDLMRCHECGDWFENVANHVRSHSITAREYRHRHGLLTSTSLANNSNRERYRKQGQGRKAECIRRTQSPEFMQKAQAAGREALSARGGAPFWERRNESGRCRAQLLFRIQRIAAELNRTPTESELHVRAIGKSDVLRVFGTKNLSAVIELAGLPVRKRGQPRSKSALLDERMPWPKDYFAVNVLERRRA